MSEQAFHEQARAHAPYHDECLVEALTAVVLASGRRVLQIHKLGPTDQAHVSALLDMFEPPKGAIVLDIGCGIGEVSLLMGALRPDLRFILLNISPSQLRLCPGDLPRVAGDMHALPLASECVDAAMVNYSLGHALITPMLAEAARVLKRRGLLFVYDLESEDSPALRETLGYVAWPAIDVLQAAGASGLGCVGTWNCGVLRHVDYGTDFASEYEFNRIFDGVSPVAYCFRKGR